MMIYLFSLIKENDQFFFQTTDFERSKRYRTFLNCWKCDFSECATCGKYFEGDEPCHCNTSEKSKRIQGNLPWHKKFFGCNAWFFYFGALNSCSSTSVP